MLVGKIVDDLLISESSSEHEYAKRIIKLLSVRFEQLTFSFNPTSFAGFKLTYNVGGSITMSCPLKLEEAMQRHLPALVDRPPAPHELLRGKALRDALDGLKLKPGPRPIKMTAEHAQYQALVGELRFPSQVDPAMKLPLHKLSRVASNPPEEALVVAFSCLYDAHLARFRGLTFGGSLALRQPLSLDQHLTVDLGAGAPVGLETFADATWGDPSDDKYGILITFNGAAVFDEAKMIHLACNSSTQGEGVASVKASEVTCFIRNILADAGFDTSEPTLLGSDNSGNVTVINGTGAPSRIKHALRRYAILMQRVKEGEVKLCHVADVENPADFLTKWLVGAKFNDSITYATGSRNHPDVAKLPSVASRKVKKPG